MKNIQESLVVIDRPVKKSVVRLMDDGWSVTSSIKKEVNESDEIVAAFFGEDSFDIGVEYAKWKYGGNPASFDKKKVKIELDGEVKAIINVALQKVES